MKNEELIKAYPYEKDKYIIMKEDDFENVPLETSKVLKILQFVDEKQLDPIYFDKAYYITPGDPVAFEGYALLEKP